MTDSIKSTRAQVTIGSLTVDGFMLPDGSYRMSQTQAAEAVEIEPDPGAYESLKTVVFKD